tara:strand:+ start:110 stop:439 length:330 start_codon:yes stop_codon:yes gene_type:complete
MLFITDAHNGVQTKIEVTLNKTQAASLILGLRFYDNVYFNYNSDTNNGVDLLDTKDNPSWTNQDAQIFLRYDNKWWLFSDTTETWEQKTDAYVDGCAKGLDHVTALKNI